MANLESERVGGTDRAREALHRFYGAVLEPLEKERIGPVHYGSVEGEVGRLRQGCGLVDRIVPDRIVIAGEDRLRFLNGLMTCNVKDLTDGSVAYGFFTDSKGRILADGKVVATGERLRLEVPCGTADFLREHMERYVVTDRVEIAADGNYALFTLAGPEAAKVLAGSFGVLGLPEPGHAVDGSISGREILLVGEPRMGVPAWTLWVQKDEAEILLEEILGADSPVAPVGHFALETVRIESGIPRWGLDFGPENFPKETGQDDAVSYEKGCYLGQEVVARIHFRGGVRKALRGLKFDGAETPRVGNEVLAEGRVVGRIGSVTNSTAVGSAIALSILDTRVEPEMRVDIRDYGAGRISCLPFVSLTPRGS